MWYWKKINISLLLSRERVLNSTLPELNVQGLRPGTEYVFRVVAHRSSSASSSSSVPLTVKTQSEVAVPSPVLSLSARATSAFSVLVEWRPPRDDGGQEVTVYKLYYRQVRKVVKMVQKPT